MDVELQILKHLARDAQPTVRVIDGYCAESELLNPAIKLYNVWVLPR
jgi:hypothetical protein